MQFRNLVLLVGAAATLAACGDDDGGTGVAAGARVRAVHAADVGAVDVLVDGDELRRGANLAYGGVTDLTTFDPGTYTLRIESTGNGAGLAEQPVALAAGTDYTVVATGTAPGPLTPIIATYDRAAPPSGQVQIRVIHGSPTIGAVDVYVTAPGAPLTDADREFPGLVSGTVSAYVSFPPGRYQVRITNASNPGAGQINSEAVTLERNRVYTFVVAGTGSIGAPPRVLPPITDR